ncbi:MAG: carboxypeptidase-like regulatory domain-containing protein [Roseivirga sp.]|nr:carboxypeptidase-like regulatory domain-containing protein [Roseivirga sp.]
MHKLILTTVISLCIASSALGQGIRGTIKTDEGETLPFASIYVKRVGTGTSSNLDGFYELRLPAGTYEVVFQYMGYATKVSTVTIGSNFETINVSMSPQVINLTTVTVTGKSEDPSYTIMRKAIAKAKYHLVQYDNYSAEVYMKGTGEVTKVPWILRRQFEKEGIDTSQVYTSESVSEIYFERPNTFKEKVISVRASGQDNDNANPNAYINSSFYQPEVVGAVSPLSPRAFSYYKFEYQGSFMERGFEINKIKVTPRSKGDDVFEGEIYIREDFWNIHSLDVRTSLMGFKVRVQQIFAPIQDEIWMPVTQQFEFSGSIFGLAGKFSYLASVSNYKVTKNEELDASVILVDEKIEAAPEEIESIKSKNVEEGVKEVFKEDKQVSRKQFRKLMREYEKQEKEEQEERNLVSDYSYRVDSLAAKKDSIYWATRRPVPLTDKEIRGYQRDDSTYVAEKEQAEADSSRLKNGERFKMTDLIGGGYYKLGERLRFHYPGFISNFGYNTVEGWNLDLTGNFHWRNDTTTRLRIVPFIRYGFASERFYGKLETVFGIGKREQRNTFRVSGGKYIAQFNPGSIDPFINTAYSLLAKKNYMRIYEKTYARASFARRFKYRHVVSASAEWASRSELFNNTTYSFFDREGRDFRSNLPLNNEVFPGGFQDSKAFITNIAIRTQPWIKFRKFNGRLIPIRDASPEFRLRYRKGWEGTFGSEVDFDHLELGMKAEFDLGVRAKIDFDATAGKFFGDPDLLFMDFKHFQGNRLSFAPLKVVGGYRLLDYYQYSTAQEYASIFSHIRFRKLFFTQLPMLRYSGIKENLFVNYLTTPTSDDYIEVGYTIDNIFRIFRLEFVQSFQGGKAREFGVRIGVASIFGDD